MNSLEFIEKEIAITKSKYKEHLKFNQTAFAIKDEEKITALQQIKTILEAWKVMEKYLEYFPSDYWNGISKEVITMTSYIDREDYPILKKALEVKEYE